MKQNHRPDTLNSQRGSLAHLLEQALSSSAPVDWDKENAQIERAGKKIVLPNEPGPMPINTAIDALYRLQADEEEETTVDERIHAFPLEAAVAFVAAMEELYGWASPVPTPTFFGPRPPHFISVQTDVDTYVQVPWGSFKIPGVENNIEIRQNTDSKGAVYLQVIGTVRKRERRVLLELAAKTREILKERSIYRGKAIHITTSADAVLDMDHPPGFLDLRRVDPNELIMNKDVQAQIDTNINAPIRFTDRVRAANIPLKRGVLLEGRYGVGKTMTTRMTAKLCVDNGWTFITIDRAASLTEALKFAQRYQPAVVFCEDIDRATETRDEGANDLLNTIDGIISKSAEVMVVLTTNHVEKIEPAMLRPGRLDAVITVTEPDADSVTRLIQLYSRGLLRENEPLDEVGRELAGNIPAVVREVVERSKLAMISSGRNQITQDDLLVSVRGMKAHLALLAPKDAKKSVAERFGDSFRELLTEGMDADLGADDLVEVEGRLGRRLNDIRSRLEDANGLSEITAKSAKNMSAQVKDIHNIVVG